MFGCEKQTPNDQIINIEEEFNIDITEQLGDSERSLIFNVSTIDAFDCLNYRIDCSCENAPSNATLYIEEILEPIECLEGISSAKCQSILENLREGENPFRIVIKEAVINEGLIRKTAEEYTIELETNHGLGTFKKELKIIPDDFIWASVTSNDQEQLNALDTMLAEILSTYEVPQINDGYYGYFSISDQALYLTENPQASYTSTYYFNLGDGELLEKLKEVVEVLRSDFETVELDLYTSNGIRF